MSFAANFKSGSDVALELIETYQAARQKRDLAEISDAKPQYSVDFMPDLRSQLDAAAKSGQYDIAYDEANTSASVTPKADPSQTGVISKQNVTDFLGQRTAGTLSTDQITAAKMAATASVLERNGDVFGALRLRAAAETEKESARRRADDAALRTALAPAVQMPPVVQARNADIRSSIGTGSNINGASNVPEVSPNRPAALAPAGNQAPIPQGEKQGDSQSFDSYLKNVAPNVLKTLVSQGKLDQAKQFQQFVESADGKNYTSAWVNGVRRMSAGDTRGAMGVFERMYNAQLFDDGHTVKMAPVDGKPDMYSVEMIDPQGVSLGSKVAPITDLAKTAALYLSPDRAVEFMATQQGKRDAEESLLTRQIQLETIRQSGREYSEDRRDDRLATRLQAQQSGLDQRLAARQSGSDKPLTAAQQRGNFEIDAAREIVQGMTPAEIRKRTAKTTDTGRENAEYDPRLARAASLAARRKLGEDPDFDGRQRAPAQQPAPAVDRQDLSKRFRAEKSMNAYKLGKDTPSGTEVLDASGKLIGHYR